MLVGAALLLLLLLVELLLFACLPNTDIYNCIIVRVVYVRISIQILVCSYFVRLKVRNK